ncbi:MAG: M56 family metallopeptidase, partial [Pirellulales bacterium]
MPPKTLELPPIAEPIFGKTNQQWWRLVVGATWLLAAVGIARFLLGLAFVHRCRRQSMPIDDAQLRDTFHSLARELQIVAPVELVEVPTLSVAATIGWRRPLVLLPANWRDWTTDERRAVLAHELSHVAQRHFPLWLVGQLAIAAHFYHPLVHWLGRRLRLEQEFAADRLAARVFGSHRRYANVLAALALGPARRTSGYASLGLFMARPLLMNRIAKLREPTNEVRRPSRFTRSAAFTLLVASALVALGLRASPQAAAADESSTAPPDAKIGIETVNSTTAILQVSGEPTNVKVRTHTSLLKSFPVIKAALRRPEVAQLPILTAQVDRIAWVHDHLDVGFFPNSEIVYVRMKDAGDEIDQLRNVVNAIVQTHLEKHADASGPQRTVVRDALAKSYQQLCSEIQNNLE